MPTDVPLKPDSNPATTLADLEALLDEVERIGCGHDPEVVAAADEHGIAMVFTGMRHFRH